MRQLLTTSFVSGLLGLALAPAAQAKNFVLHEQDNSPSDDEGWTLNDPASGVGNWHRVQARTSFIPGPSTAVLSLAGLVALPEIVWRQKR